MQLINLIIDLSTIFIFIVLIVFFIHLSTILSVICFIREINNFVNKLMLLEHKKQIEGKLKSKFDRFEKFIVKKPPLILSCLYLDLKRRITGLKNYHKYKFVCKNDQEIFDKSIKLINIIIPRNQRGTIKDAIELLALIFLIINCVLIYENNKFTINNTSSNYANTTSNWANTESNEANTKSNWANTAANYVNSFANDRNSFANWDNTEATKINTISSDKNTIANDTNTYFTIANNIATDKNTDKTKFNSFASLLSSYNTIKNTEANKENTTASENNTDKLQENSKTVLKTSNPKSTFLGEYVNDSIVIYAKSFIHCLYAMNNSTKILNPFLRKYNFLNVDNKWLDIIEMSNSQMNKPNQKFSISGVLTLNQNPTYDFKVFWTNQLIDTSIQAHVMLKMVKINEVPTDIVKTKTLQLKSSNIIFDSKGISDNDFKNKYLNEFGEHSFKFIKLEIEQDE